MPLAASDITADDVKERAQTQDIVPSAAEHHHTGKQSPDGCLPGAIGEGNAAKGTQAHKERWPCSLCMDQENEEGFERNDEDGDGAARKRQKKQAERLKKARSFVRSLNVNSTRSFCALEQEGSPPPLGNSSKRKREDDKGSHDTKGDRDAADTRDKSVSPTPAFASSKFPLGP